MVNYINEYIDKNAYDGDSTKDFPNVSLIDSTDSIEWALEDTNNKVTVVESFIANSSRYIIFYKNNVSAMSVDGVPQQNVSTQLTLSEGGDHTLEFELIDPTVIEAEMFKTIMLESITLPNSVRTIGRNAFDGSFQYSPAKTITIGDKITSIGNSAFNDCRKLESVTILATTPPTLGTYVFSNHKSSLKFYVPAESVAAYKADSSWISNGLTNLIYAIPE